MNCSSLSFDTYGIFFQNSRHCNFQLLTQISFQIYNFISNITYQNWHLATLQMPHISLASNNITDFIQLKNMKFAHSWKLPYADKLYISTRTGSLQI